MPYQAFRNLLTRFRVTDAIENLLGTYAMNLKSFTLLAGVIFAIVALAHLLRVLMGWPIVIDTWTVPIWLSWIALAVAGGLSYFGFSLASRS